MLAQATRRAPTIRACVNAAVIPLSLKLPDGFIPSYWSSKLPSDMPTYWPTLSAFWSRVCPSPMVTTMGLGSERQEIAKPPDTREVERVEATGPPRLEVGEGPRDGEPVPVVNHVHQVAADRTREVRLVDGEGGPAPGMDALLERGIARRSLDRPGSCRPGHRSILIQNPTRRWSARGVPAHWPPPGHAGISPNVQIHCTGKAPAHKRDPSRTGRCSFVPLRIEPAHFSRPVGQGRKRIGI